jgi:branched-subunit amino acid transport protein
MLNYEVETLVGSSTVEKAPRGRRSDPRWLVIKKISLIKKATLKFPSSISTSDIPSLYAEPIYVCMDIWQTAMKYPNKADPKVFCVPIYFLTFLTRFIYLRKRVEFCLPDWSTQGLQVAPFSLLNVFLALSLFLSHTSVAILKEHNTILEAKFAHLVEVSSAAYLIRVLQSRPLQAIPSQRTPVHILTLHIWKNILISSSHSSEMFSTLQIFRVKLCIHFLDSSPPPFVVMNIVWGEIWKESVVAYFICYSNDGYWGNYYYYFHYRRYFILYTEFFTLFCLKFRLIRSF